MTKQIAFLFPGQGSQSVGMLSELAAAFPLVQETFAQASAVLGYDLWALVQSNPDDKLNQTAYTQPALLAADVAVWRCWQALGGEQPAFMAGHSLGEYAALVCAGSLSFEDGLALVAARGQFMQAAVAPGVGSMAAVIGLDDAAVQSLCDAASSVGLVSPANYNSVGQVVVAGETAAVDYVIEHAKSAGARMATKIPVSVPSHCVLMQPAADKMMEKLANVTFKTPQIPVVHNADVKTHDKDEAIRDVLVRQLVSPVRWVETIQYIQAAGVAQCLESGPGKVLAGLNKRISRELTTKCLQQPEDLKAAVDGLSD